MTRHSSILIASAAGLALAAGLAASPALADLGHLGEVAGHSHWLGLALAAGATALIAGFGRGKKAEATEAEEADEAEAAQEAPGAETDAESEGAGA